MIAGVTAPSTNLKMKPQIRNRRRYLIFIASCENWSLLNITLTYLIWAIVSFWVKSSQSVFNLFCPMSPPPLLYSWITPPECPVIAVKSQCTVLCSQWTYPSKTPHSHGKFNSSLAVIMHVTVSTTHGRTVNRKQTPFILFRAWKLRERSINPTDGGGLGLGLKTWAISHPY